MWNPALVIRVLHQYSTYHERYQGMPCFVKGQGFQDGGRLIIEHAQKDNVRLIQNILIVFIHCDELGKFFFQGRRLGLRPQAQRNFGNFRHCMRQSIVGIVVGRVFGFVLFLGTGQARHNGRSNGTTANDTNRNGLSICSSRHDDDDTAVFGTSLNRRGNQ